MRKNRMKIALLLAAGIVMLTGCSGSKSTEPDMKPLKDQVNWEKTVMSEEEEKMYELSAVRIEKVDEETNTAKVVVSIPDIEEYLKDSSAGDYSKLVTTLEFPVEQVDGKWKITSMEPLREYIREEASSVLYDEIGKNGGIVIEFNPQGAK